MLQHWTGFGPSRTDNRDSDDIFGFGDQPDYGFEGFGNDGFGFEFGEGFSHDEDEGPGYERRLRQDTRQKDDKDKQEYREHYGEYEYPEYEDAEEESYRKILILKNRGQVKRKRIFDFGF